MPISYFSEDSPFVIKKKAVVNKWLNSVILQENHSCGEINYIFCSDAYLLEKNRKFLNHDTFTDIITFDYSSGGLVAGDIFISIPRVEENAKKFGVAFELELSRVMVHGVLHLLGYGDKTRAQKLIMRSREDFYLPLLSETSWK